jgi:hypothetical protein
MTANPSRWGMARSSRTRSGSNRAKIARTWPGVGGGGVVAVAGLVEDAFQQEHVGRLVVDDEDAGVARCRSHG